jgi:hypothetical protein
MGQILQMGFSSIHFKKEDRKVKAMKLCIVSISIVAAVLIGLAIARGAPTEAFMKPVTG